MDQERVRARVQPRLEPVMSWTRDTMAWSR